MKLNSVGNRGIRYGIKEDGASNGSLGPSIGMSIGRSVGPSVSRSFIYWVKVKVFYLPITEGRNVHQHNYEKFISHSLKGCRLPLRNIWIIINLIYTAKNDNRKYNTHSACWFNKAVELGVVTDGYFLAYIIYTRTLDKEPVPEALQWQKPDGRPPRRCPQSSSRMKMRRKKCIHWTGSRKQHCNNFI